MASITNLIDFKKYCLRNLGAPVVTVDITDEQMEDRWGEALKKFGDYHFNGTERMYLKHQVTQTDVDNGWIPLPDYITGVVRVLPYTSSNANVQNPFNIQYQLRLNDIWDMGSTSVVYYAHLRQYMTMLDQLLNGQPIFRFNKFMNRVSIDTSWGSILKVGDWVIVECYRALDPTEFTRIFDDTWLRKYTTALFKRQWGTNLKKFQGVQLIGGAVIDGNALYDEAMQEIEQLDQELRDVYEEPVNFFMG